METQNNFAPVVLPPDKQRYFNLTRKDLLFAGVMTALSVFTVFAGLWGGFRAGFTASYLLLFAALTGYSIKRGTKLTLFSLLCGLLSVVISFNYSVSSNGAVNFTSTILLFFLTASWFYLINSTTGKINDNAIVPNAFAATFGTSFGNLGKSFRSIMSRKKNSPNSFSKILVGALCALPVLFIVVPLLINSDAAFESLVKSFKFSFSESLFELVLGIFIAPFIISYGFGLKLGGKAEKPVKTRTGAGSIYYVSFFSILSACYLVYLFSQLAYFFSAFSGILPKDYSFSVAEYARRGFFEMAVIAVINFALSFFCISIVKKNEKNTVPAGLRAILIFIGMFTLLLISTALSKMILYIKCFGLTELRILTSVFMIFIGIVYILLLIKCFVPKIAIFKTALILAATLLCTLGICNTNKIVADYNVSMYQSGYLKEIDISNLEDCSTAAVPALIKLANGDDAGISVKSQCALKNIFFELYTLDDNQKPERIFTSINEMNYEKYTAYTAFDEYIEKTQLFAN